MMIINRPKKAAGLYIHIPFCLKKCGYCDFLSFDRYQKDTWDAYGQALKEELLLQGNKHIEIDTIFIGGGTPSLLHQNTIRAILKAADAAFSVHKEAEITIEANPKTLTEDKLAAYRKMGINRLSMGAQSMDDAMLRFMGRAHDRSDFLQNYRAARAAGFENINVDLMFGIPGQTIKMWEDSLRQVLELEPEHLSFYSLQLEEGTEFCRKYKNGEMDLPDVSQDRRMYHEGIRMLKEAGFHHYEISNCAKPGFECCHNLKYWNFDEYLAAGLGAHSFQYDRGRACNVSNLDTYIQMVGRGALPKDEALYEAESLQDYIGEYVFTALRKTEGVDMEDFARTFGRGFFQVYQNKREAILQYEQQGLVTMHGTRLALTEQGFDCSNEIMAEFV